MGDSEDGDFTALPLPERLEHKLWKARLHGYQELNAQFQKASLRSAPRELVQYWNNPDLFSSYIADSNVVAQEQAIAALQSLLEYVCELADTPRSDTMRACWLPVLAEKGLSSSRASTKAKSQECVLLLVSLDRSIQSSIELLEPSLSNKLPRLVASCVECIAKIIESFGIAQVTNMSSFLTVLLEPLPKLSSHADRNVRSQTMNVILQLYKWLGRDVLQELLLEKLKPIQQRDLDKMFQSYTGEIPPASQPRPFQWQKGLETQNDVLEKDKDGDTLMGGSFPQDEAYMSSQQPAPQVDPFELFPAIPVLEKLPPDFQERITSSKWKDRVEVLEEVLNQALTPAKKFEAKGQDYSDFLRILAHVIEKDANVQAVTFAAQSVQQLCQKLRGDFTKSYGSIVLNSLLERSKEKKASVNEAICEALNKVSDCCGVDACLEDTLSFMSHKTPQVRMESTKFLTRLLKKWQPQGRQYNEELLIKLVPEISQASLKIVGDTQPGIRDAGFECLATLMKLVGERELSDVIEKLDNLKKKKVFEHFEKVEVAGKSPQPAAAKLAPTKERSTIASTSRRNVAHEPAGPDLSMPSVLGSTLPLRKPLSTIPSKRGPSSPLKTGDRNESQQNGSSSLKSRLTTRSLTTDSATTTSKAQAVANAELEELRKQKQKWLKERQEFLGTITEFQNRTTQLNTENLSLQQQLSTAQSSLHERTIELRSKEMQITRLQDRVSFLESELEAKSTLPSSNYGVRSASSFEPPSAPISQAPPGTPPTRRLISSSSNGLSSPSVDANSEKAVNSRLPSGAGRVRSPSECSDDLPHRVNSLQLRSSENAASTNTNNFLNDESWKRAAEVTSQLKARIERMRAKTRGMGNS